MTRRSLAWIGGAALLLALPSTAHAAEGGLEIFPHREQLVALLGLFVLLIFPAHKLLFQPILRVLDDRAERIEGARRGAERLSGEADEVLDRYEAAVQRAREGAEVSRRGALDQARHEQVRLTAAARADAEREMSRARSEVAEVVSEARGQLRREAQLLAREAASRVLGRSLS